MAWTAHARRQDMTRWHYASASELARGIRSHRLSAVEALSIFRERHERHHGRLNAIVVSDFEQAMTYATAADRALRAGDVWGPLHGVPVTIKESFDVRGWVTSWGVPAHRDYRPTRHAAVVRALLAAGANLFGKTNVPAGLGDWQTWNDVYGETANPWSPPHTPGGSSGGAAAALAAGLTALDVGSDIAASIRVPAHYCGVYGHKPTAGVVSARGQQFPGRVAYTDMATVGPMARSAEDLALAMRLMAGPDEMDAQAWRLCLPPASAKPLKAYRVAFLMQAPCAPVDDEVQRSLMALADWLGRQGVAVSLTARPDFSLDEADALFRQLVWAVFGARQPEEDYQMQRTLAAKRGAQSDWESRVSQASVLSHRDWLHANERRALLLRQWMAFFQEYDVLICPAAATTAPLRQRHQRPFMREIDINGVPAPLAAQFFWAGYAGAPGLPATVAPVGLSSQGLPVGAQLIGPLYGDMECIRLAGLLEQAYYGFVPPHA